MTAENVVSVDFDSEELLPDFVIKLRGEQLVFDPLILQFKLDLHDEKDPEKIVAAVKVATGITFTAAQAIQFVRSFVAFLDAHEPLLKKAYGRSPSSSNTTESLTPNTDNSPEA